LDNSTGAKNNKSISLAIFADRGDGSKHSFLHTLDRADQILASTVFVSSFKDLLDEVLDLFPDLSFTIPLVAFDCVFV